MSFPKDKTSRKKVWLSILMCFVLLSLSAQERKLQNRPYIDLRKFHYGFLFGLHEQGLSIENNGYIDPATSKQWFSSNASYNAGFTVGVLGELRINKTFGLRLIPTMHFGSKNVTFREQASGKIETQEIKSTYISLPINLKISAPRFNNYRPYVMTGINPMYDLTTKKRSNLLLKPFDCYFEVGLGCDFYLPFFKFIPELKFCFGLSNLLQKDRSDLVDKTMEVYTQSINKASANMIVLTLYFE
ncbi:MAG: porin family protein [Bacteroidaceae bacterium]